MIYLLFNKMSTLFKLVSQGNKGLMDSATNGVVILFLTLSLTADHSKNVRNVTPKRSNNVPNGRDRLKSGPEGTLKALGRPKL
jgi:hypothetical protein